jgi:Fic family protein
LVMYRGNYDFKRLFTLSEFYDRDRSAYYAALQTVRGHNMDMTGWLEYYVGGLATQMQEVRSKGEQVIKTDILALRFGLSDRQRNIVRHLAAGSPLSIEQVQQVVPGVHRRTVQRDLAKLVEKGLITTTGATNQLRYALRAD